MESFAIRRWETMYPALLQVHGGPDPDNYLFSAFRQVQGEQDYSVWLFGDLMHSAFNNYLTWLSRGLTCEERREVAEELEGKFADYVRACVDGDVDEAVIQEVRAAYELARDMSATWRLLF